MSEGDDMNDLNTPNPEWGNPEAGGQTPQYGARYNAPEHSKPPYNTSSAGVGGVPGLAIGVRRFHDQNLSGGLYAALYAVGTLASIPTLIGTFGFLAAYGSYDGPNCSSQAGGPYGWASARS